jgi:hypothetical protein
MFLWTKTQMRRRPGGTLCTILLSQLQTIHLLNRCTILRVIPPMSRPSRARTRLQIRQVIRRVNCRMDYRGADHHPISAKTNRGRVIAVTLHPATVVRHRVDGGFRTAITNG